MTTFSESSFAELPMALVEQLLEETGDLSERMLADFEEVREKKGGMRKQLADNEMLRKDSETSVSDIPTCCGVDGSYAVERLLSSDLVIAASVAVEGLTPPSEKRFWPDPKHLVITETEPHDDQTATVLRALMIGMELEVAVKAPHDLVLLDGSSTTPLIFLNQAANRINDLHGLRIADKFISKIESVLRAYSTILASQRSDHTFASLPKYTSRREIGEKLSWDSRLDDRGLLTFLLDPGEYTVPTSLQKPREPWHINLDTLPQDIRNSCEAIANEVMTKLGEIQVVYYRCFPWLPALRIETSRSVTENRSRLAALLAGVKHQCISPAMLEPYPLYMADRMVKHLPRAIPTFRQIASQAISEKYSGSVDDVLLGLHSYRTEGK